MKTYIKPQIKVRELTKEPLLNITSLPVVEDETINNGDEILSNESFFDDTWDK